MPDVAEQVETIRRELRETQKAVVALADSTTDAQWVARPASGGWSASECIAHLTLTNDVYVKLLADARANVPQGAARPARFKAGFLAWLLAKSLEPPAKGRVRTTPEFVPGGAAPKAESIAEFVRSQQALLAWIDANADAPLNAAMITSPFNARLRYNAYGALRITTAHQRRHIWQAERATRGIP
jgi:hypothetical protein